MSRFWEYCFYRYCQFYLKHPLISFGLTKSYDSFGERFVSTQQFLNMFFVFLLVFGKILDLESLTLPFFIFFALACVIINIVNNNRYNKSLYKQLEEKYKFEKNRRLKGILVVLYWLLSTFSVFALAFF